MKDRAGVIGVLLLALVAAAALAVVARDDSDSRRVVLPAIDSDEAVALCAASSVKLEDFWARAKAIGVAAAIVRPQPLEDAVERGEILHFTRAEVERWKAVGLLPPNAPLRPDSFWTKDARLYDALLQAMSSQGVSPTTGTLAGFRFIVAPEGRDIALRGYDPVRVAALGGVVPIYADDSEPVSRAQLRWEASGVVGRAVNDGGPDQLGPDGLTLEAATWTLGGSKALLLRRALSTPRRLLVLRLDPRGGVDGSLDAVRSALREIEARGASVFLPGAQPPALPDPGWRKALCLAAAWILGIFGPLLGARGGLVLLRRLRQVALEKHPALSPVLQLLGGLAATAAFAALAGALVHAFTPREAPLDSAWWLAALAGPIAVALLTLYTIDLEAWGKALRRPATYAALLRLLAIAAAAALLLAPRATLQALGLGGWSRVSPNLAELWWWPWRWRETLVGFPCLLQAMFLVNWRLDCPDCTSLPPKPVNDPRGWFLLGLLAPIGIVQAVGRGGVPESAALLHTIATFLVGAGIGAVLIAWRLRITHEHHHTASPSGAMHHAAHSH